MFFSFGFKLSIINALALTVIIAIGVMLPAAPGFVGNYHYACVLGLTFFGIGEGSGSQLRYCPSFLTADAGDNHRAGIFTVPKDITAKLF